MSIGDLQEDLSQAMLVGIMLVGRLGVAQFGELARVQMSCTTCILRTGGCSFGGHSKTGPSSLTCSKPLELGHCIRTHY